MDEWVNYLKNTNKDVFEMIKNMIKIAATDHPDQFREKRDKLAEALFTYDSPISANKEDNEVVDEVMRIKGFLEKSGIMHAASGELVCDLLNKLRDMRLSIKILEVTGIGKTVVALKKHELKDVNKTANLLYRDWRRMVREYLDGKNSVVVQEEEECGELTKNHVKPVIGNDVKIVLVSKQQTRNIVRQMLKKTQVTEKDNVHSKGPVADNEGVAEGKREDESKSESSSELLQSIKAPRELNRNMKLQTDSEKATDQKGLYPQCKKAVNLDEKFEASKRKLQENYKQEEVTKKRRRVQVLEFHELGKHGILPPKDPLGKRSYARR